MRQLNLKSYNDLENLTSKIALDNLLKSYNKTRKIFTAVPINVFDDILLKENKLQNKIYFKNLLNEVIKNYSG